MADRRALVGVIGHVDHGKTALVGALTGMQTDRLAEEQRRGISITLGFAHFTEGNVTVDLVDMPGHERFVRTMVSGATGVDTVLVVVSAAEGIKPQTVEHLDIAGLLGLRQAVVAVSKADLVDPAAATTTGEAAAALARRAGLAVAAVVLTSTKTGQGIAALRAALLAAEPTPAPGTPPPSDAGFPYLPIDRVFTMPGHGTVVTGTLRRGALTAGDTLTLTPGNTPVRLRSLQVHGVRTARAEPGQRVAANLRDLRPDDVPRGAALTDPGRLPPSRWLTVSLQATTTAPKLPTLTRLLLLFGTHEIEVQLRLLDRDVLEPGQAAPAQLRCAVPACVPARERFILRRASPPETLGGGTVLDPAATRLRRFAPGVLTRLARLTIATPAAIMQTELDAAGPAGVTLARLAQIAGVSEPIAAGLCQHLPVILGRSRTAVLADAFDRTVQAAAAALAAATGELSADQLSAQLSWAGPAVLADALAELVRRGTAVRGGAGWRHHRPQRDTDKATQDTAAAAALAEALRQGGLTPPDLHAVAPTPQARHLVDRLVREGVVIRAPDKVQKRDVFFHQDAVEAAKRQLTPMLASGPGLLVGEAGVALGISRKFCVPLLEHLDAVRFTRRIADRRTLAAPRV